MSSFLMITIEEKTLKIIYLFYHYIYLLSDVAKMNGLLKLKNRTKNNLELNKCYLRKKFSSLLL